MTTSDRATKSMAVIGCGVIGSSWAAFFLAHGFDVLATDPGLNAEKYLRNMVETYWPVLENMGLEEGASRDRLKFTPDLAAAAAGSRSALPCASFLAP